MVYSVTTTIDMKTIKDEIASKAKDVGFGILNSYEFKKILHDKGFPIEKEIIVFELCNPEGAQQALNYMSDISVYLPCRISLYENNGMVTLSSIGLEEIVNMADIDERFKSYMTILFENLKQVMHSWDDQFPA
jgi:uncharacterized protein (DUF302 family)